MRDLGFGWEAVKQGGGSCGVVGWVVRVCVGGNVVGGLEGSGCVTWGLVGRQ